jgi:isopenicillin N synthase-like dioxygenase
LAIRLIKTFAAALGQPENIFEQIYTPDSHYLLKIIRYPGRDATESDQGSDKDGGFVTVLLQDVQKASKSNTTGNGLVHPPSPVPSSSTSVKSSNMASNGYLLANVHRVVTPPAGANRLSVAFFFNAQLNSTVPLLELPADLAAKSRGATRDPLNPLFREIGKNQLKSRLRSHPDVAQRHHADLLASDEYTAPKSRGE